MLSRFSLLAVCVVGGCATNRAYEPAQKLDYRCGDLVVIGRVTALGASIIPDPAPIPNWQSRWQLQVQIKRVIRGSERRSVVPATGVSHARIRDDLDFLAVLHPAEGGGYFLETAAIWDMARHPKLAEPCS